MSDISCAAFRPFVKTFRLKAFRCNTAAAVNQWGEGYYDGSTFAGMKFGRPVILTSLKMTGYLAGPVNGAIGAYVYNSGMGGGDVVYAVAAFLLHPTLTFRPFLVTDGAPDNPGREVFGPSDELAVFVTALRIAVSGTFTVKAPCVHVEGYYTG